MSALRKIDFGVCLQVTLELVRMLERMEMETVLLLIIGLMLMPFILTSLWTLGMAVIWQLVWLGFKAGMLLFFVASVFTTFLGVKSRLGWRKMMKGGLLGGDGTEEEAKPKCTLLDTALSIFFHTGLRLPATVWDAGMELYLRNGKGSSGARQVVVVKKERVERPSIAETLRAGFMASPLANMKMFSPIAEEPAVPSDSEESHPDMNADADFGDYLESLLAAEEEDVVIIPAATPTRSGRRRRSGTVKKRSTRSAMSHHQMY